MRPLLRFGWHLVGSQLITYAGNNLDSVIVGNRFGAAQLGFYNRAYQLLMGPLAQMLSPSTTVALPVLGRLRDDEARFAHYLVRAQLAMGYTMVAGLGLLAGVAEPVTRVVLGETWLPLVPILRLMAIAGAMQTLAFVGYWVYVSRGLTTELRRFSVVSTINRVICIAVGSHWGVMGVAAGFTIAPALAWPLSIWWLSRRTPLPARELWLGALRIMSVSVAAGGSGYLGTRVMAGFGLVVQLGAATLLGLLAYAVVSMAVPFLRADVTSVALVARKVGRR
jgi:PST family polysaccharide transporter